MARLADTERTIWELRARAEALSRRVEELEAANKQRLIDGLTEFVGDMEKGVIFWEDFPGMRERFRAALDPAPSQPAQPDARCPRCGMAEVCDEPDCPNADRPQGDERE